MEPERVAALNILLKAMSKTPDKPDLHPANFAKIVEEAERMADLQSVESIAAEADTPSVVIGILCGEINPMEIASSGSRFMTAFTMGYAFAKQRFVIDDIPPAFKF